MRLTVTAAVAALVLPLPSRWPTTSASVVRHSAPSSGVATSEHAAKAPCDPWTRPVYNGKVPKPRKIIGFDLGTQEVRNRQSDRYVRKVAAASPRVRTGVLATTGKGRPVVVRHRRLARRTSRQPSVPPASSATR